LQPFPVNNKLLRGKKIFELRRGTPALAAAMRRLPLSVSQKKPRVSPGLFVLISVVNLHSGYVRRLQTFRSLDHFERYAITLHQGFESVANDCREVAKNVFAVFLLKKAKPFRVVEPFHRTICHFVLPPDLFLMGLIRAWPGGLKTITVFLVNAMAAAWTLRGMPHGQEHPVHWALPFD
jgi:hypothetical protein